MRQNKRFIIILIIVVIILLIPLIAMQFTEEVYWTLFDFIVAGILLLSMALTGEIIIRKIRKIKYRIVIYVAILFLFLLIWTELAVGIFGTPFAGN